jgi:hypothetical protein
MLAHKTVAVAVLAVVAVLAALGAARPTGDSSNKFVGGYLLMSVKRNGEKVGMKELAALAANAKTLPVNRIWISFFAPTLVYTPGSNTLATVGLNATDSGDYGFAEIKQYITQLQVRPPPHLREFFSSPSLVSEDGVVFFCARDQRPCPGDRPGVVAAPALPSVSKASSPFASLARFPPLPCFRESL